jgi:hypothetical protein
LCSEGMQSLIGATLREKRVASLGYHP